MSEPSKPRVLIVDDEKGPRESLRMVLKNDYDCLAVASGAEALAEFPTWNPNVVLLDIRMPEMDGIALLERLKEMDEDLVVIMVTALVDIRNVVEAIKKGAADYLVKSSFNVDEVKIAIDKALENRSLRREVRRLRSEVSERYGFANIVGKSKPMRALYDLVERLSEKKTTVLICGERGTGKELVAKAIHWNGPRRDQAFITVNCGAIPESLIESELFGHERGAFTDAIQRRAGQFELANAGTIFLDEVGELSPLTQTKLLRVLQEREFRRVGGSTAIHVDVRVIAATNRDLDVAIAEGRFRADLYDRLNVVSLALPPLRERREDIPLLVDHFIAKFAEEGVTPRLAPEAMEALAAYDWPGNARELENAIERALALASDGIVTLDDLPQVVRQGEQTAALRTEVLSGKLSFDKAVEDFERDLLATALARAGWVQTRAAAVLGVSRRILKYKMDNYGLVPPDRSGS